MFEMISEDEDPISKGFKKHNSKKVNSDWYWSFIVVDGRKF